MRADRPGGLGVFLTLALAATAAAGDDKSVAGGGSPSKGNPTRIPAAVGPAPLWFGPPYFVTVGPDGRPVVIGPPVYVLAPTPVVTPVPLGGPWPVPGPGQGAPNARVPAPARARKVDASKAGQLQTIGDRLFRAGNLKRAEERYEQAARIDPAAASPLVRLAQVALVRGLYGEALAHYRSALDAEPGWLARAPNVALLYGEPRDHQKVVATLESHLLAEPDDRDAWLVLGAQLYLSGQTRRAADVFLRLSDRRPDPTLAAFRDAASPPR